MKKEVEGLILLLLGGIVLKITLSGSYVRYVKPGLWPLLLVAGGALVAIAIIALWPRATSAHMHQHEHPGAWAGWLLVVPALVLVTLAPPALGSFQASRSGTALPAQESSDFAPLPAGDPVRISVLEYATRAVYDEGRSLQGRMVTISGFVVAGPNGTPYLTRMVVSCCAADARPIKVGLTGDVPADLGPDKWIEIDGSYSERVDHDPVNDEPIPFVSVTAVRAISAPESGYVS